MLRHTVFIIQVPKALKELEFKVGGIWTVIDQEGRVFSAFAHVDCAEIE